VCVPGAIIGTILHGLRHEACHCGDVTYLSGATIMKRSIWLFLAVASLVVILAVERGCRDLFQADYDAGMRAVAEGRYAEAVRQLGRSEFVLEVGSHVHARRLRRAWHPQRSEDAGLKSSTCT
jgi:hypothetical protein